MQSGFINMQTDYIEGVLRELRINYRILEGREGKYYLCKSGEHAPFNIRTGRGGVIRVWSYLTEDLSPVAGRKKQDLQAREGKNAAAGLETTREGILSFFYEESEEGESEEDAQTEDSEDAGLCFKRRLVGFLHLLGRTGRMLKDRGIVLIPRNSFSGEEKHGCLAGEAAENPSFPDGETDSGSLELYPDELFAGLEEKLIRALAGSRRADSL